jgi:hypothetical protein
MTALTLGGALRLLNSVSMLRTDCFEFRRRIDGVIYRFEPVDPKGGYPAWKRVDLDLWLTRIPRSGWCVVDVNGLINSRPWNVEVADQQSEPPEGEWLSKRADKSYVYDLLRFASPGTV